MKITNFLLVFIWGSSLLLAESHEIVFWIRVPDSTNQVILIGNHKSLGNWDHHKAVFCQKINDSLFTTKLEFPIHERIEFKITGGGWDSERLDQNGKIPGNFKLTIQDQDTLRFTVFGWKNQTSDLSKQVMGNVKIHSNVYSPQLNNERTVIVWLPPSYTESENNYPVLYLHDGQNVFSSGFSLSGEEWELDETVTTLIADGAMKEIIMVAVYHGEDRTAEYSPKQAGEKYADFLIHTIKPWIDTTYRTLPSRENTAVLGSSMGGIISFHLGWEHSDVFSMAGCLSPAFLVDHNEIVKRVNKSTQNPKIKCTIQNGTEELEARFQPSINKLMKILYKKGYNENKDYLYKIYPGAFHTESAWAEQVKDTLLFFFGI